jgi:tight adherence protein B
MGRVVSAVVCAVLALGSGLALGGAARASRSVVPPPRRRRAPGDWCSLDAGRLVPRRWRERREQRAFELGLPGVLEAMAGHLRSGASLRVALLDAVDAAPPSAAAAMSALAGPVASGAPLVDAVAAWASGHDDASTRLAAAAIGLAATTGGAPARSLDAVAATLRDRIAVAGDIRAASAQARLSTAVVGAAPLAFAVFAGGLDPRTVGFLVTTPVGLVCLGAGIGLDVLGLLWMRHLAAGVAR